MKKYISLFLCLTCILTLVACGKKAAPIQLPQTSDITSVDVTVGENTTNHSDTTWISEIISDISVLNQPVSKVFKIFRRLKVISRLIFSLKQEQAPFLPMRKTENTISNSLIKEFIKLTVSCTNGCKKQTKI